MPCLAGETTAAHLDAVQPWHEAFGFGLLHESAVFGGFALVRCREVGFEWNGQFHEVYCGVRVQDYDVRSPCRVAAEWQLVGASGEVDLDIAVWVLALDVREEVLQDAVVTPCVGPGVEEVLAVVQHVVQRLLYAAVLAGGRGLIGRVTDERACQPSA